MDRQKERKRERSDVEKDEEKKREDGADIECVDAGQHSGRGGITHSTGRHFVIEEVGKNVRVS